MGDGGGVTSSSRRHFTPAYREPDVFSQHNTCVADRFQDTDHISTDDLLHLLTVLVRKAEESPETADQAIIRAMRVFDRIVERMA